jgi:hypothetical protein
MGGDQWRARTMKATRRSRCQANGRAFLLLTKVRGDPKRLNACRRHFAKGEGSPRRRHLLNALSILNARTHNRQLASLEFPTAGKVRLRGYAAPAACSAATPGPKT